MVRSEKNKGFGQACNLGVSHAKAKIILFLNTDVEVKEGFLEPIPQHFKDPDVFAVRINVLHPLRKSSPEQVVYFFWEVRYGLVRASHEIFNDQRKVEKECAHVGGSHGAVSKEKFLELSGFDELYRPIYMEDVDLSYRALKRGWKINYEPQSVIIHKGGGTMQRYFKRNYTDFLGERNQYLFFWKNISDTRIFLSHFFWMPFRLFGPLFVGNFIPLRAFCMALVRVPELLRRRGEERKYCRVRDQEIFQKFGRARLSP